MSHFVTIIGSPSDLRTPSSSRYLGLRLQAELSRVTGVEGVTVDVGELVPHLGVSALSGAAEPLAQAIGEITSADLILVVSPVYKGSYTGLFKHVIDLVDYKALAGVPVGLVAVGGSDRHALAVEHQFRPLFATFNAATLPTGVFVVDKTIREGAVSDQAVSTRLDQLLAEARDALIRRREGERQSARVAA